MIEIDGINYFTIEEIEQKKLGSKTTIYRRVREGRLTLHHGPNGKPLIKVEDITKYLKKNSAVA